MKRSSPLLILVAFTLAILSYGGKQAETPAETPKIAPQFGLTAGRTPSGFSAPSSASKTPVSGARKTSQGSVVIAEFPPLEIEEIH